MKKSPHFVIPDLEEIELKFGNDPDKMPAKKFLEFHNKQFEDKWIKEQSILRYLE
jgi:hypothetical protein